ncbi:MAG TPA: hypothetical protein VFX98_05190 [Longimicrobiaceae bacterium]|nr:hypothetical protein [Longimicrobiaceae bacterium]
MSLHLFSTPVQCTSCGTVVDDPTKDRCPKCGALLKERRAPRRLAGVEERYGSLRILVAVIRFLAVLILLLGGLVFISTLGEEDARTMTEGAGVLVGSVVTAVALFSLAAFFVLAMDLEENTRSSFRLQQMILEELQVSGAEALRGEEVTLTAPVDAGTAVRG